MNPGIRILSCALLPALLLAQKDSFVSLHGHVKPLAKASFDQGPVDPSMKLNYVLLMLRPAPEQQSALDQLLLEQQNPGSPNFRKWVTPEQFADRFGASASDVARISEWMRSQGFEIITTGRGRRFIAFNATAAQIQRALKTEIHHYRVEGELHFANATEPSVPAAIAPVVQGFLGLDDFQPKAKPRTQALNPNYSSSSGDHALAPGDLAVIYDLIPVYTAGVTGAGQKIAVIGRTDIEPGDMSMFRSAFGLSSTLPQQVLVPGSTDPGVQPGDETESDLDLEWSAAIAPDAQVIFVYSPSVVTSLTYAIDQRLAPVISFSYGECEGYASSADAGSIRSLAQQGNAEGITWMASSGDSGAAACDQGSQQASYGATVNMQAALPEVTGVGGTMFDESTGSYWATQNANNQSSALSYIPETVWNESTANRLAAGGGGFSSFFPRASWQAGPGVPPGNARGIPDISLTAASGHDPYIIVNAGQVMGIGGTSAAAPSFAAMVALLNQYLGTNGLGNINPNLYRMAQTTTGVFHDITTGGNYIPCVGGSPDCGTAGNFGFAAGPGWDAASGLGSVDAAQMLVQWSKASAGTTTTVTANPSSIALNGSTQLTATVTSSTNATPSGTVAFTAGGVALGSVAISGSSSTATGTLTVYGSQLPTGNDTISATYGGDQNVNGSVGMITVVVSLPQAASAVVPSVNPNPVFEQQPNASGDSWFFTVTLSEVAGASTTLTGFTFNGTDYSSSIQDFFGSANIPANGTLSANLETGGLTVPAQVVMSFTGMDAGGRQWTQQITVPFYGKQLAAAMQLIGAPDTIQRDPTQSQNCQWFQDLGLQEQNGHPVYLKHFYAAGHNLSDQIATFFGSTTLPAFGALVTGVCWDVSGDTLPETLSYEVDGVDDGGNKVTATATVKFQQPAASPGALSTSADQNNDYVQLAVADATGSTSTNISVNVQAGAAWSVLLFPSNRTSSWLTAYPLSGTGPGTVTVLASGSGLSPGLNEATLVFQSTDALPQSIPVTIDFVVGTPRIASVVNGAGLTSTGLSPGLIFTVFGSVLGPSLGQTLQLDQDGKVAADLDGVEVTVNGTSCPLLYVGANQINAVAPYDIAGSVGTNAMVQVYNNGVLSNQFMQPVVAAAPAIFSLGNNQGAILNQDGTVNGPQNPAARGSYIQIYGTGEGQTNPPGVDGAIANESIANLARPVASFSLTIGGVPAPYIYAGTAPQSFAGFFQVDAQIPAGVSPGPQPVILNVGGATSAPLNVAVK